MVELESKILASCILPSNQHFFIKPPHTILKIWWEVAYYDLSPTENFDDRLYVTIAQPPFYQTATTDLYLESSKIVWPSKLWFKKGIMPQWSAIFLLKGVNKLPLYRAFARIQRFFCCRLATKIICSYWHCKGVRLYASHLLKNNSGLLPQVYPILATDTFIKLSYTSLGCHHKFIF